MCCPLRDPFENFLTIHMSDPDQNLINNFIFAPVKTTSTGGTISSKGVSPQVMSMEVPAIVSKELRFPSPKPTPTREVPKIKNDK